MCLQDLHGCFARTTASLTTMHVELGAAMRFFAKLTTQYRTAFDHELELTRVDTLGLGRIVRKPSVASAPLPPMRATSVAALARGNGRFIPFDDSLLNFHERRGFVLVRPCELE
jgi:hypothetical protein